MTRRPAVKAAFLADVLKSSLIKDAARVFLMHLATVTDVDPLNVYGGHPMTADGKIKVARDEVADALGITVKEVSNRTAEAVKAGLLVKVSGGRNGQVAGYRAQPQGHPRGQAAVTQPDSLAAFVNLLSNSADSCRLRAEQDDDGARHAVGDDVVGTPVGVPGETRNGSVGTPVGAPYARAHYSTTNADAA